MKEKIIAEANFLQQLIFDIYIGREEFTGLNWITITKRLQSIRNEARKEDERKACSQTKKN